MLWNRLDRDHMPGGPDPSHELAGIDADMRAHVPDAIAGFDQAIDDGSDPFLPNHHRNDPLEHPMDVGMVAQPAVNRHQESGNHCGETVLGAAQGLNISSVGRLLDPGLGHFEAPAAYLQSDQQGEAAARLCVCGLAVSGFAAHECKLAPC